MLASRGRLASLLAEQQRRLELLAIAPWHTTGPLVCRRFSDALFPEENVDLNACDEDGQPLWRQRDDWIDGWVHMLENHRQATYLFRAITARRAVTATAHVGSDNGMKIWLNGKEIFFNEKLGLRRHQHATVDLALSVRAMVGAGDILFLAGPPDVLVQTRLHGRFLQPEIIEQIQEQQNAVDGQLDGIMWAVSAKDGTKLSEQKLNSLPVFDGLIAANERLLMSTTDGRVICYKRGM